MLPFGMILKIGSFIWKYKKIISFLIIVLTILFAVKLYGDSRYEAGKSFADEQWTNVYNEMVLKHNTKVQALEMESKLKADEYEKKKKEADNRIGGLLAELRRKESNTIPKPSIADMKTIQCKGSDGKAFPLYDTGNGLIAMPLGKTFSDTWNAINKEVTK